MDRKKCPKCGDKRRVCEFFIKKGENRHSSWCKACLYQRQKERWTDRKKKAVELLGGKCSSCGYDKNYAALDFHHVDPTQKKVEWSKLRLRKWSSVIAELQKCVLLCRNCHAEYHWPHCVLSSSEFLEDNNALSPSPLSSTGICPSCKSPVYGTKYCSVQCAAFEKRKVERPTAEQLRVLLETQSFVSLGKKFGVSDNAVRKWGKQYGIL